MRRRRWWILNVLLTIAALWFASASLTAASYLVDTKHTADFYAADKAHQVHTTATVTSVSFEKNKKFGGSTSAEVAWDGGKGSDNIYLSDSEDVTSQAPVGHPIPVVVWQGHVVRFEFGDEWHKTDTTPDAKLVNARIFVYVFLAGAVVCGRIGAHRWLQGRVYHGRFLVGDLMVLPFLVATVVVANTSRPGPVTSLVPVTLGAVVFSAFVLPAVPWMRTRRGLR